MELDFLALFEAHYDEIVIYLRRRLMDRSLAEDLAQETFEQAIGNHASFDRAKGLPRAWLFGIATHRLHRHFREELRGLRAYARAASRELQRCDDEYDEARARIDSAARAGATAKAIASVSHDARDILALYAIAELSYAEISGALGIPLGTVGSRLSSARRQLRAQLDPNLLEARDGRD